MLASGVIAVGTVSMLPVGAALAEALVLSGANRWNAGQSTLEVGFGAAADTFGVTSLSLGLWGRDPVTGQEVVLTPEDGTYEMIVGASSIAMLASMPFANGLRGPTTTIRMPTLQMRAVESISVVGDTRSPTPPASRSPPGRRERSRSPIRGLRSPPRTPARHVLLC